jgi:hypothetical protein
VERVAADAQETMEDFHHFGRVPIVADVEVTTTTWAAKEKMTT